MGSKKLTRVQQEVVELLRDNETSHLKIIYNGTVVYKHFNIIKRVNKLVFNSLSLAGIIKPTDNKDIYVLNEKE